MSHVDFPSFKSSKFSSEQNISYSDAENIFLESREKILDHFSKFDNWEQYKNEHLSKESTRFDKKYCLEQIIEKFKTFIYDEFFSKYPWLTKFSPRYQKRYSELLSELQYHNHDKPIILQSRHGKSKVELNLFNITEEELWYPNIKIIYACHSADHSKAPVLMYKDHPDFINHQLIFHQEPLQAHPGDREYTTYYALELGLPLLIGKRLENLAFFLQRNGVPKKIKDSRWCTDRYKFAVSKLVYERYFFPWKYKLTKKEIAKYWNDACKKIGTKCENKEYCTNKCELRSKSSFSKQDLINFVEKNIKKYGLKPPNKTNYERSTLIFPINTWNFWKQCWESTKISPFMELNDKKQEKIPKYPKYYKIYGEIDKDGAERIAKLNEGRRMKIVTFFLEAEKSFSPNNIIQMLGIAQYQSSSRAKMNPNIKLHPISRKTSKFFIFQYLPIHGFNYKEISELINSSGLREFPYNIEYDSNPKDQKQVRTTEIRYGCIWCPFKDGSYYLTLKKKFPIGYFYCHLLRTIASAKSIISSLKEKKELTENDLTFHEIPIKEYFWWDSEHTPKNRPEWECIM
ncbi:MAG: hypothetical protein EAX96_06285 [Candidatus Lokiarchaeota archaeon]|nr:hypothetical protein [Candidatus Lokiarchaeota archaeon]